MTPTLLTDLVGLALGALALFAVLTWQASRYSQAAQWNPPAGTEQMDWTLRRNLALVSGCLVVVVCAVSSVVLFSDWPSRLLATGQSVVMAVAGASDLRRFHLPLPLTVLGFGLALAAIVTQQLSAVILIFGLAWACVVILLHVVLSKGSMQLGDHLATLWIALASPFNGLLAMVGGDIINVIQARTSGLRGKKVAAAGAWLLVSAALMGFPPYVMWFYSTAQTDPGISVVQLQSPEKVKAQVMTARTLAKLAQRAGDYTAQVAFEDQRDARIVKAREASMHVMRIAVTARKVTTDTVMIDVLHDLADALAQYDVPGVRDASERLSDIRYQNEQIADAPVLLLKNSNEQTDRNANH